MKAGENESIIFPGFLTFQLRFVELMGSVAGERPKRGEWGVRVVGWHRFARQLGGGFNVALLVEAGA